MLLHKLQMIQNSAARLVTGNHGRDHITPVLFKLQWLPVRSRIHFKLLVLVYQAVHHLGPTYLTPLVTLYAPTRSLRSAAHRSLKIPQYNLERYGRRVFSVTGLSVGMHVMHDVHNYVSDCAVVGVPLSDTDSDTRQSLSQSHSRVPTRVTTAVAMLPREIRS